MIRISVASKKDIEKIVNEQLRKSNHLINMELDKLRKKIYRLEEEVYVIGKRR